MNAHPTDFNGVRELLGIGYPTS